jgi:hypothetical protein
MARGLPKGMNLRRRSQFVARGAVVFTSSIAERPRTVS